MSGFGGISNPYGQVSNPYGGGGPPPGGDDTRGAGGYPPAAGGGYPPPAGGAYPPQGGPPAPGGYPPPGGGAPGGYPPQQGGGAPGGYPPPGGGAPGGYPPQGGGAPGGYPPPGGAPGGYPPPAGGYPPQGGGPPGYPGQADDDRGKMGNMAQGLKHKWDGLSGVQQGMAGLAVAGVAGGGAYAAHQAYQGHQQNQQYGQQGGYPQYHASGHSTGTFAAGGAAGGALLGAGGMAAYQQYQQHQNPGQPQQMNWQHVAMAGAVGAAAGGAGGFLAGKFFNHVKHHHDRDYVIIVDKSGSMCINDVDKDRQMCTRWDNARRAVELLAPKVTECDKDGVTLYLFSRGHQCFRNIRDARQVSGIFQQNEPNGSTDLAGVLDAAFHEFFSKGKPMTILVITDGEPDDEFAVKRSIEGAANRLRRDADLSVTFIQCGDDVGATEYLKGLDDKLQCRFDIVDTVKDDDLRRIGFEQLIQQSVND
eukprot:TRINITY_DN1862_c0_g1_i3.p2 TRINITY_DN1862_c0_g1~~TRINITY_DN1862_c0_g1_i3.p2  ORF type:complete len:521 (+),score=164.26 TRINITY_DN1862_c0_g1_i3:134-1564(+)